MPVRAGNRSWRNMSTTDLIYLCGVYSCMVHTLGQLLENDGCLGRFDRRTRGIRQKDRAQAAAWPA